MRILLVEDDKSVAKVLKAVLTEAHYAVDVACDGQTGWQLLNATNYDLILLDVVLPKLGGLDFCRQLRKSACDIPVLLVTSLDSSQEKIAGLNAGADDYITKPFEVEELLARIRALLRRVKTPVVSVLKWGDLNLQPNSREVTYGARPLQLTPKEYVLLELFLRNPAQVFSRSAILDSLWSYSDAPGEETVTSHVKGLRRKLSDAGAPDDLVQTVYGVGYRLKPADKEKAEGELPNDYERKLKKAIATLWQSSAKRQQLDRIEKLVTIESNLRSRDLSKAERQLAYKVAHSLNGTLGIFGFSEGSQIASKIEQLVKGEAPFSISEKSKLKTLIELLGESLEQTTQPVETTQLSPKQPSTLPLLLLIDTELKFVSELVKALWADGLTVKIAPNARSVIKLFMALEEEKKDLMPASLAVGETSPDVILLKFSIDNINLELFERLLRTTHPTPQINAIVCSASSQLGDRVKLARLGNYPFLDNPSIREVIKGVREMRSPTQLSSLSILAVDDDSQTLKLLSAQLSQKGLQIDTLTQPLNFWQRLQACVPDLLLLDVEMPQFNGLELCQAIRQAPEWSHLPVVFLTAHADPKTVQAAIEAGADDLLEKTLPNSVLFDRLIGHLKRSNLQRVMSAIATVRSHP